MFLNTIIYRQFKKNHKFDIYKNQYHCFIQLNLNFGSCSQLEACGMSKPSGKFQQNIRQIGNNVNAYIKTVQNTNYGCLVLHQHLGLVQNIAQTAQFLLGTKISIIIPDLFLTVTSKTLLNNQFDAIQKLIFSRVLQATDTCFQELKKKHQKIFIMGFSVGSAYAFKILQKEPERFQFAFLFYGVPDIKKFSPNNIKTKVVSFFGTDDKIKYLSDYNIYQELVKKCKNNTLIKFEQINGVGHGFANPESSNFSQKAVLYCQKIIFSNFPQQLITHPNAGKIQQQKKKEDCGIF